MLINSEVMLKWVNSLFTWWKFALMMQAVCFVSAHAFWCEDKERSVASLHVIVLLSSHCMYSITAWWVFISQWKWSCWCDAMFNSYLAIQRQPWHTYFLPYFPLFFVERMQNKKHLKATKLTRQALDTSNCVYNFHVSRFVSYGWVLHF